MAANRSSEWSTDLPNENGLWWYRVPGTRQATPVEYVPTDKEPLLLHHPDRTYRWLSDEHFANAEWRGPIAKRTRDGLWYFLG